MTADTQIQELIDSGATFVVNHSGGKDSQAMSIILSQIIPADQILLVHAELPEADWQGIPQHINATKPQGWVLNVVSADKTFFDMVERRFESRPEVPSFPSPQHRQCTSDLKRGPVAKLVRYVAKNRKLKRSPKNQTFVHCIGIRAEESSSRAKQSTFKLDKRESKAGRTVYQWLPIHEMTETEVRRTVADEGQELHPAYAAGMTRLSCCFCIMASKGDLTTAAKLNPELYARYVELEQRTGYTMSMSGKPLTEVTGIDVQITNQKELF